MLTLATAFLYWVRVNDLERENHQLLADEINVLRLILGEFVNDPTTLDIAIKLDRDKLRFGTYYHRILDNQEHTLVETPGMGKIMPVSLFPSPIEIQETPEDQEGVKRKIRNGGTYLLMAAWVQTSHPIDKKRLLQVAIEVSKGELLIATLRRWLLLVFLFGFLFSAGASVAVARRGLRPLEEMTRKAQRVKATQLHERISVEQWPEELKALAAAFDEMLDRLEDSFKRLSQFSADLAHELRTPINNLMGEAEVTLFKKRTADELRGVIESSLEEYGRLSRIIDSLLFLARADSPEGKINKLHLDVQKEIQAVREFHDAVAKEQGVEVVSVGNARLYSEPILFRRLISNLLSNALKYTPQGGKIAIDVKVCEDQWVEVRVNDTGSGIAPEHLPKIFDRFYRADRARSQSPQEGIGLGLAIVKSIMDLHRGTITLQSEPSRGTTVILRFPPAV